MLTKGKMINELKKAGIRTGEKKRCCRRSVTS